ncbi:CheY-like chemotaxis protein [Micromonospora luteifusca]|uniref:CheY-like chemotaxis protein n=1 Tax=Micromonospora luteifusca TaxID=709860 RepID=A0ABS2LWX7_9ACTN|nr:response regulator transcription factor [Micromonospora luteifusca]MBM7492686.1 CheY-like chemotaxis protein [Micromonospora luteifusca]
MSVATLPEGSRILVIDDDLRDAKSVTHPLQDAGYETAILSDFNPLQDADAFLASIAGRYDALVCDYILSGRSTVKFNGAEVVSKSNRADNPKPAVLISSHVNTDQTAAIRTWRAGIPAVVDKSDFSDVIVDALDYTLAELSGAVARERRAFATPIEILDVLPSGEYPSARVVVVGWKIDTSVWMPLQPIVEATRLAPETLPGKWLEARVNCHAKEASDLFYEDIIVAPDLPEGWL